MKKKIYFVILIACVVILCLETSCATQKESTCGATPSVSAQSYDFTNIKPSKQTPIKTKYKPRYK
jgi:PBP1b-binding outer membrane lipoprotein LpoB